MANFAVVGKSVYRKDAHQKVTGQVLHVGNIEMPGMLHVAVLRSPYAHARITRIEKFKAERVPGVAVILTGLVGAKGVGETDTLTASAAIAKAIHDATGVRIRDLPITPERVLRALAEKDAAAVKDGADEARYHT